MEDRLRIIKELHTLTTLRAEPAMRFLNLGAVSSVACLEWGFRDTGSDAFVQAKTKVLLPVEIHSAKETRNK